MNGVSAKKQALIDFSANIAEHIKTALEQNKDIIIDYNTEKQLYLLGETSEGEKIDSYRPYHYITIRNKRASNQPFDRVTLKDTGDFYRGFYIIFGDDGFTISSMDNKTEELVFKYGIEIFGLTIENIALLSHSVIKEALLTTLKQIL